MNFLTSKNKWKEKKLIKQISKCLLLFYRIFSLIESVTVDNSDAQMNYKNSNSYDDNIVDIGLTTTLASLAQQSSHQFLKVCCFFLQIINKVNDVVPLVYS